MYRTTSRDGVSTTWATREIAALDFLLGIPLEAERSIVRAGISGDDRRRRENRELGGVAGAFSSDDEEDASGLRYSRHSSGSVRIGGTGEVTVPKRHRGGEREESERGGGEKEDEERMVEPAAAVVPATPTRWWEKLLFGEADPKAERAAQRRLKETQELERPDEGDVASTSGGVDDETGGAVAVAAVLPKKQGEHNATRLGAGGPAAPRAPGRRLEGRDDAITVQIPRDVLTVESMTSHRGLARQAAVREWEMRTAHGIDAKSSGGTARMDLVSGIGPIAEEEEIGGEGSAANRGLLDGRAFFSSCGSYPVGVFSVIKYDPKSEEAARRRKKLEDMGGGGTQFVMPVRDWRGISYRALLPRIERKNKAFNRFLRKNRRAVAAKRRREAKNALSSKDHSTSSIKRLDILAGDTSENTSRTHTDDDRSVGSRNLSHTDGTTDDENEDASISSSSSEESDSYVPGFLDDPEMVQGRHRHVMIGDQTTGPIVCSTIQFVQPADLKADLNRQFRERFDGWEPPKAQRKYIGARIIDGVYTPYDPTEEGTDGSSDLVDTNGLRSDEMLAPHRRMRSSSDVGAAAVIRMPPSLTLSKIRSVKQQALVACVKANIEISTVALACCFFERLCLDCRVDKSNRRLSFAACLLLSAKINEANVAIVHDQGSKDRDDRGSNNEKDTGSKKKAGVLRSWIRPTRKSRNITEALFEFFTHDWSLSLKHLFAAEWVVFTALGFEVHATPYQVAFHFKRLMKVLEWNPLAYLGREMYDQWQACLDDEAARKEFHEQRKEMRRKQKERKLLRLQRELHQQQAAEEAAQAAAMRASNRSLVSDDFVGDQHSEFMPSVNSVSNSARVSPALANSAGDMHDSQSPVVAGLRQVSSTGQISLAAKNAPIVSQKKEKANRRYSGGHHPAKMSVWNRLALKKQSSSSGAMSAVDKTGRLEHTVHDWFGNSAHAAPLVHSGKSPIKRVRSSPGVHELLDQDQDMNVVIDVVPPSFAEAGHGMSLEGASQQNDDVTV